VDARIPKREAERRLWRSFRQGRELDLGTGDPVGGFSDSSNGLMRREIRGSVITQLLLGATTPTPGYVPRLRLSGAHITGPFDLSGAEIACEVNLTRCLFDETMCLQDARTKSIGIAECRIPRIDAAGLEASGSVSVGSSCVGSIGLKNAIIHGQLTLSGSSFNNPTGRALDAANLTVDHAMICADGFTVHGEMMIAGSHIGNQLDFEGATFINADGTALQAYDIRVGQSIRCTGGFRAIGEVRFPAAQIGSLLRITEATLVKSNGRFALHLEGLVARMVSIDASIDGPVILHEAHIGSLSLPDSDNLRTAPMMLDGMTYDALEPVLPARRRVEWIRNDPRGFNPQPYEELARSYRSLGHDRDARISLLAKRRSQRNAMQPKRIRPALVRVPLVAALQLPGLIFDALAGYGYVPLRALIWMMASWVTGWCIVSHNPPPFPTTNASLNSALYALDLLLPTSPLGLRARLIPHGSILLLSIALRIIGWTLSIAILPAVVRAMSRQDR
jgi:hypothetical protein